MKLLRIGPQGHEKPAILDERDTLRDLSRHISDISGDALLDGSLDRIRTPDLSHLQAVASDTRVGPCVGRVDEAVCVGLNYSDHAAESGMAIPTEPILFLKASTAICGPYDDALIPRGSRKTDREAEPGVVIGKTARYVEETDAMNRVADYCIVNDVSEREYQLEPGDVISTGTPPGAGPGPPPRLSPQWAGDGTGDRRSGRSAPDRGASLRA